MQTCPSCQGFLPAKAAICPHCDQAVVLSLPAKEAQAVQPKGFLARLSQRARLSAISVGTGAAMMTLMACYGGPPQAFCNQREDKDGDGYYYCADVGYTGPQEDCDDKNKAIHPGADDPPGDGIDQNCDGKDGINQ